MSIRTTYRYSLHRSLLALALMLVAQGAIASRYDALIDSLKTVIPQQQDTAKLASIVELDRYLASSAPKEIFAYLEEGYQLANVLGHNYYTARMLNLMGSAHYYLAEYDLAKSKWNAALDFCRAVADEEAEVSTRIRLTHSTSLMNLGVISRMRGEYSKALDYYHQSLELRQTTGYKLGIAACYINIAKVYVDNKNDERALSYYLRADALLRERSSDLYHAGLLNNIGLIYKRKGELDSAKTYFDESLALYKDLDEPKRVSQTYVNLGLLYKDMDDCDKALDFYSLALIINKEISDRLGMAWCYQYIGECYGYLDQYADAIDYYQRALTILEELKVATNQIACYKGLADIYARIGQYQQAYNFHTKYATLNDSVYSDQLSRELAEQEASYASAEKERQLKLKDLELSRKNAQIEKDTTQKWALFIGFLLVVAVAVIFIQRFRIEARLHKKLEGQNEELKRTYEDLKATVISKEEKEVMIKEIHHRVKNNLQIISSLVNLQANSLDDNKAQHLFREIQNRIISMSLLHEKLYKSPDLAHVNVSSYMDELLDHLMGIYATDKDIFIEKEIAVEDFAVDTLIPIGLLVNEIVTNALKYAFKGREKGTIKIKMYPVQGDFYALEIADDGVGLATEKVAQYRDSLGMELIDTFVTQLDGEVGIETKGGTRYTITFLPQRTKRSNLSKKPGVPTV